MTEYGAIRVELELLMRQAGTLVMSYYQKSLNCTYKQQGFSTEADRAVEQFLLQRLGLLLPAASFCAEESGMSGDQKNVYCWVIDSLDGTTNFFQGLPYFCISVALTFEGEPVIGVVYQPVLDELFYAEKSAGAWFNGDRIEKHQKKSTIQVIVVSPWTDCRFRKISSYTVRYCGSVALDCAYVACGKFDGLKLDNLGWWDIAAGILLMRQAGVVVTHKAGTNSHNLRAGDVETHQILCEDVFNTDKS